MCVTREVHVSSIVCIWAVCGDMMIFGIIYEVRFSVFDSIFSTHVTFSGSYVRYGGVGVGSQITMEIYSSSENPARRIIVLVKRS